MNNTFLKYLDAERDRLINSKKENLEKVNKIELSLVDDFNKKLELLKDFDKFFGSNITKLRNKYLDARALALEVADLYQDAELNVKDAKEIIAETESIVEKLAQAAKDLGVDVKDIKGTNEVVSIVANIEDDIDTFEKTESDYTDLIKSI